MSNFFSSIYSLYANKKMVVLAFMGFFSAIPFTLINSGINTWLAVAGVDKSTIGFFSILSLPYTLKFIVAPFIDAISLPFIGKLGRRVSWMLVSQVGVAASIMLMAFIGPGNDLYLFALFAVVTAVFSAVQDIAIDAFRAEVSDADQQGAAASVAILGYRLGILVAGGLALMLIDALCMEFGFCDGFLNWTIVFWGLAIMAPLAGLVAQWYGDPSASRINKEAPSEDIVTKEGFYRWCMNAVVSPFKDFVSRVDKWVLSLLLMVIYRACDAFIAMMMGPFLIDMGFTLSEIGTVIKSFGFIASVIGGFIGGVVVNKLGIGGALYLCGVLQMASNIMFIFQEMRGHDLFFLYMTIATENICGGMASIAYVAFAMSLCSNQYAATQYALMTSLAAIDKVLMGSISGITVELLGWKTFFSVSMLLGVPALFLVFLLYPPGGLRNAKVAL